MKMIGNYTEEDFKELKLVIYSGAKNYLGITNLPDQYDLKKICEFIHSYFKDLTAHEIDKAMSMYAAGTIVVQTKPYGVISLMFLSEVLQEFRLHKKSWRNFELQKSKNEKLLNEHQVDPVEKGKKMYDWILNYVIETGIIPESYGWDDVFIYLEHEKIIDLSYDDKIDFLELVRDDIRDEIKFIEKNPEKKELLKELFKILSSDKALGSLCRKKLVILHLSNQLNNQTENQNGKSDN